MSSHLTKYLAVAASAALALTLSACGGGGAASAETSGTGSTPAAEAGQWPRTVTDEQGQVEIPSKPERIVSTALSATGTLLAIDAPVVGTSTSPGTPIADENGFFNQWADTAVEREVEPLYAIDAYDPEAVLAADPDLIVVSTSGADSQLDRVAELKKIAPTIVVNYGDKSWQDLATELGQATGQEAEAAAVIQKFDDHVAEVAASMQAPDGTTSIVSYTQGETSPVGKTTGPHATLIGKLGFTVQDPPAQYDTSEQKREDFAFTSYEGLSSSADTDTVLLLNVDDSGVEPFLADPTLANIAAVQKKQVHGLGKNSFRLDYYSATEVVDGLGEIYAK